MLWDELEFKVVLNKEYVTIRHCLVEKFIWNEWRGTIPSPLLREAMMYACDFVLANKIELILAGYTYLSAMTMEDQVWIAYHSAEKLQHSELRKVANLMAKDIFQQIAIESIYNKASEFPLPCESRYFVSREDALEWLFAD